MPFDDPYKYMISGYYGIEALDEYVDKQYLLNKIKKHISSYLDNNRIEDFDYDKLNLDIENNVSLVDKLQDALILLNDIDGPMELRIIIKQKISDLKNDE